MRAAKYRVTLRHGTSHDYASKRKAMAAYRSEVRDGWTSSVTDLTTGARIAPRDIGDPMTATGCAAPEGDTPR